MHRKPNLLCFKKVIKLSFKELNVDLPYPMRVVRADFCFVPNKGFFVLTCCFQTHSFFFYRLDWLSVWLRNPYARTLSSASNCSKAMPNKIYLIVEPTHSRTFLRTNCKLNTIIDLNKRLLRD